MKKNKKKSKRINDGIKKAKNGLSKPKNDANKSIRGANKSIRGSKNVVKVDDRPLSHSTVIQTGVLDAYKGIFFVKPDGRKSGDIIEISPKHVNGASRGQVVLFETLDGGGAKRGGRGGELRGDRSGERKGGRSGGRASERSGERGGEQRGGHSGECRGGHNGEHRGERNGGRSGERRFGRVVSIVGYPGDPGVDILSVVMAHGFSTQFRGGVLREADALPDAVDAGLYPGRLDLRNAKLFTIDGADAKDLDDAVSIELLPGRGRDMGRAEAATFASAAGGDAGGAAECGNANGVDTGGDAGGAVYKLGVHIADVAEYVAEKSKIDMEARRRGTSLYYAGRVAPMLPPKLSNGICSLHPGMDRLALTVFMYIDGSGRVLDYEMHESIICSVRRITYSDVCNLLENRDAELINEYSDVGGDLELMRELAQILRAARVSRGALDFTVKEAEVSLDDKGVPISICARETTFADQIIEEFMIACNETVAEHMEGRGLPCAYRVHEPPKNEKMEAVTDLAGSFGIRSTDPQAILAEAKGTSYEQPISYMLLRSMEKAVYSAANIGHYGLVSRCYCHFTAPIRRYPDLLVHRAVKTHLRENTLLEIGGASLQRICESASERERAADDTEREIEKMKKAEYMQRFLGDAFSGTVSGVTSFGMFVELENTVEGLVRMSDMDDDYYIYDRRLCSLAGKNSGKTYRLGDSVNVQLVRANAAYRQIDFIVIK